MSELLFQPGNDSFSILHGVSGRLMRARNHHDRNSKRARRFDLGVGRSASGVLGHKHIDLFMRKKRCFSRCVEGAATEQKTDIGRKYDTIGRIDHARDVVMMRSRCEGAEFLPAKAQKDTTRLGPQRISGGFRTRDGLPLVIRLRLPGGAHNRGERDRKSCAGGHGVGRDLIGVGVRCINDRVDLFPLQPSGKTIGATEPADPCLNGLHFGVRGAPGKRDNRLEARVVRKQTRQLRGLRGPSENENAYQGHLHDC